MLIKVKSVKQTELIIAVKLTPQAKSRVVCVCSKWRSSFYIIARVNKQPPWKWSSLNSNAEASLAIYNVHNLLKNKIYVCSFPQASAQCIGFKLLGMVKYCMVPHSYNNTLHWHGYS